MDNGNFLFAVLLVFIASHAQAMTLKDGQNELGQQILQTLEDTVEEKRDETDPAEVREEAIEKLLELTENGIERWDDLEDKYAEFLTDATSTANVLQEFIGDEVDGIIAAADILPEEVQAIRVIYGIVIEAISVQRDRVEFFENEVTMLKHWRRLTRMDAFQIPACEDLGFGGVLAGYEMQMAFENWKVIAEGITFAFETILSKVFQEWQTCLLSEVAELYQDPNFSGFACEEDVARKLVDVGIHLSLLLSKLNEVGTAFDSSLTTWRATVEDEEDSDECFETDKTLDTIDELISVGVTRRANEAYLETVHEEILGGFQQWLASFSAQKRGVDNNKEELVSLLEKLLQQNNKSII